MDLMKSIFLKNDRRFIEEIRKFSFAVFYATLDYLYTYEAKHNIELLIPGPGLPLRKAVSSS